MIIQGGNAPITIDYGEDNYELLSGASKIECSLCVRDVEKIHWHKADVTITTDGVLKLPLTESQTMALPSGAVEILVKLLDEDDVIWFDEIHAEKVKAWADSTTMTEDDDE